MTQRWVLNRAGIINVYQYGDETIEFGGGRLLLRGVNGSGKSTAMNMLLPFLLEADTRRIDAAGEQSGVLRSWMLSGRDEPQPQGYLWLEVRRGDEHLAFGCGIRANRSTERVTTWWFVTSRRPGIDLALVQQRTALGADALRAEIGSTGTVFTHDQRAAYRAELATRLYGGADLDQHLRLLHVVRNPRVGDRIDQDLPGYLEGALPQLSESALDDAAQPLEDLEQHRRNVEDLTTTSAGLGALLDGYRAYARTEIHRRASDALATVAEADRRARAEAKARDAHRAAVDAEAAAAAEIDRAEADGARLRVEIDALKSSDAYRAGTELVDLRAHVHSVEQRLGEARKDLDHREQRLAAAVDTVDAAARTTDESVAALRAGLGELSRLAAYAGLAARPPELPAVRTRPADGSDAASPLVPEDAIDVEPDRAAVRAVGAAGTTRRGDVREVREALDRVDRAERELEHATRRHAEADGHHKRARADHADARARVRTAADEWIGALDRWAERLDAHRRSHGLEPSALPERMPAIVVDRHRDVHAALLDAAQATIATHETERAALVARRDLEAAAVAEHAEVVAELAARTFPAVPTTAWQRADERPRLADVVDFADDVPVEQRTGIEAAMEAAGLLGAELQPDGSIALDDGTLIVRAGTPVATPLADLLTVTVPDELTGTIDPTSVEALLASISVDPADLDREPATSDDADTPTATTVVTTDGRFRLGVLRGRHTKEAAEHIGVTARRAALDRQRAAAAEALARAEATLAATEAELTAIAETIAAATVLRDELPSDAPVLDAVVQAEHASRTAEAAADALAEASRQRDLADAAFADAIDAGQRTAATLGLPADRAGLDDIDTALRDVAGQCRDTDRDLVELSRATHRWLAAGRDWVEARADRGRSMEAVAALEQEHEPLAMRLATLEDAIGLEYASVLETLSVSERDLAEAQARLDQARAAQLDLHGAATRAAGELERAVDDRAVADRRCAEALPAFRAALAIDGLLRAALLDADGASDRPQGDRDDSDGDDSGNPGASGLASAISGRAATTAGVGAPDAGDAGGDHTGGEGDGERPDGAPSDDGTDPLALLPVVAATPDGVRELTRAVATLVPKPTTETNAESVRMSLRQRRATLGAGWDAEDHQPDDALPLRIEVNGPLGRMALADALTAARDQLRHMTALLSAQQDQALRNLLQGLIAKEVADKLLAAGELVDRMNQRLDAISTSHGIGVSLRWRRRDDLDPELLDTIALLAKPPDLRSADEDHRLAAALAQRIATARAEDPELPYRELVAGVLDYRSWHRMTITVRRPGRDPEVLGRRTALSEGEKKMVSYLPLFAAVAASCDALADHAPDAPRFVLLDDAFAKVSEDNHPKLFGLLVELDLDFIATSERLWGTHATVPELSITEVLRDAELGVIVLEHSRWDGAARSAVA